MWKNTVTNLMSTPDLVTGDIHLWKINLDVNSSFIDENNNILSSLEEEKAQRLINPLHQNRTRVMKVQQRLILSKYLGIAADAIKFSTTEFGKPYIESSECFFNVSHSQGKAVLAISLSDNLGVDIECWRDIENAEGIVKRHYSEPEQAQWLQLKDEQKKRIFFDMWTRKEAFIKATGRGLGLGLSRVSFDINKTGMLLTCPEQYGAASSWFVKTVAFEANVSMSVMAKGDHKLHIIEAE